MAPPYLFLHNNTKQKKCQRFHEGLQQTSEKVIFSNNGFKDNVYCLSYNRPRNILIIEIIESLDIVHTEHDHWEIRRSL